MSRIYRTGLNRVFEVDQFNKPEKKHLRYLLDEYGKADNYQEFEELVEEKTLEFIRENNSHPLWSIYLDLVVNVGIKNNELEGKISDMIIEKVDNTQYRT